MYPYVYNIYRRDLSRCLSNMYPPTNSAEFTAGKRGNVIYNGPHYTLNRKRLGTDGVEKSYLICTVSGSWL